MNKPKRAELMAEIGSFKTEKIALDERLTRYQDELAAARERIFSMEELNERLARYQDELAAARERISSMEERFELIALLAAPPKANDSWPDSSDGADDRGRDRQDLEVVPAVALRDPAHEPRVALAD